MADWVFAPLTGASIRRDPQESELFKTEGAGEGEYAGTDALVREVIQNSMDAGTNDGPVRVRFSIHGQEDLPDPMILKSYFERLKPALAHRDIRFTKKSVPDLKLGFLVCEDFGTRGLGGSVHLAKDPHKGHSDREDFFWFWRNIGRSGKTGDDLGRWGLGKTVYRAASRVGCMFGLTTRACDKRSYVMGQAVLRLHEHDGKEWAPEGFFCARHDVSDLPIPIEDPIEINEFKRQWAITRKSEPGLSIVVPYVTDALRAEALLRLSITNFFVPILQGRLVVDIAGKDLPGGLSEIRVDIKSIERFSHLLDWKGKVAQKQSSAPPVEFVRRSLDKMSSVVPSEVLGKNALPRLDEDAFSASILDRLRKDYANEELVGVRVRLALPKRTSGPDVGELMVFMQRKPGTERFESYFVREGMTISRLNSKRSLRGVQAWVLVEKGPLSSLLGDTEGPAHVSWDTSNDERANLMWKLWKGRVTFCSRIIDELAEFLCPPSQGADFDLLSDFFSIENTSNPSLRRQVGDRQTIPHVVAPLSHSPRWFRCQPRDGGFKIMASNTLPVPANANLRVSIAYDITGGDPLNHWSPIDFDFQSKKSGAIQFAGKGLKPRPIAGNVLSIDINADNFEITATGFDIHRDLFIRIEESQASDNQEEVSL